MLRSTIRIRSHCSLKVATTTRTPEARTELIRRLGSSRFNYWFGYVANLAHHVDVDPDCADFDTFAGRHPALLDKRLLNRHYRSSTLAAAPARRGWVKPDLLPFPWSSAQGSRAC